ncbi:MAG: VOC family protein, partial [Acidimicrobiales bacterium]
MIIASHSIIYAEDPEQARAFFRDVLDFPFVDAHGGWLIFKLPPAELGIHPTDPESSGHHELYLMCDDINKTVSELETKGVEFTSPIEEQGFGLMTSMR